MQKQFRMRAEHFLISDCTYQKFYTFIQATSCIWNSWLAHASKNLFRSLKSHKTYQIRIAVLACPIFYNELCKDLKIICGLEQVKHVKITISFYRTAILHCEIIMPTCLPQFSTIHASYHTSGPTEPSNRNISVLL